MKSKNRQNLQVVRPEKDQTDDIIDQIMDELRDEENPVEGLDMRIARHKKKFRIRIAAAAAILAVAAIATYIFFISQTYDQVRMISTWEDQETDSGNYVQFMNGVLKYSKDGASYIDSKGNEQWNQSYQIKNPIVDMTGQTVAIADSGGNTIMIFEESGRKGEIQTTLSIEKISVSEQGVVAAILKNEDTPRVICYDAAGNILVEHKAAVTSTGYPIDISLSPDGELLLVSYLYTQDNVVTAKIAYYNFGKVGQDRTDNQVTSASYEDAVMPTTFFLNNETSVIVGDRQILIYKGAQIPELHETIDLDKEIKSACYADGNLGIVLKNEGKEGYELRLYNASGKQVMTANFKGEYSRIRMSGNKIIMYEGNQCLVYMKSGQKRFEGEMDANILEIIPISGFNKYLVMSTGGVWEVRFVK